MVTANQWLRVVSFLLFLSFTQQTLAEIYKCQRPDGSTRFSDAVCKEGPIEAVTLLINSPLDSTAERANIAAYKAKKPKQRSRRDTAQQVVFIADTSTEERNARITEQESDSSIHKDRKIKKRGKSKKKAKKAKKTKTKSNPRLKQKKAD